MYTHWSSPALAFYQSCLPTAAEWNARDFFPKIEAQAELLMKKTEGVYAKPGIQTVILDSDLAGILAHEAVGHSGTDRFSYRWMETRRRVHARRAARRHRHHRAADQHPSARAEQGARVGEHGEVRLEPATDLYRGDELLGRSCLTTQLG